MTTETTTLDLKSAINSAVEQCSSGDSSEEQGGLILKRGNDHLFVKLDNQHSGNPIAHGLWEPTQEEYGNKILPLFKENWEQVASFHTHPSFAPWASSIDRSSLFPGFNNNFIYAPSYDVIAHYQTGQPGEFLVAGGFIPNEDTGDFDYIDNQAFMYAWNNMIAGEVTGAPQYSYGQGNPNYVDLEDNDDSDWPYDPRPYDDVDVPLLDEAELLVSLNAEWQEVEFICPVTKEFKTLTILVKL